MQFFYWLVLLLAFGIGMLAVQNSNASHVTIKFIIWRFEISLIHTVLGSIGTGILVTLFLWIPRAIRFSIQFRELRKRMENAERTFHGYARRAKRENGLESS